MSTTLTTPPVTSDQALRIAEADAATTYENLNRFRIEISLEDDGWHVKYRSSSQLAHDSSPAAGRITSSTPPPVRS